MDYMLVIIAVAIFLLTIVMNGVVMIHFSDEQDKNQAWLPKLVVVRRSHRQRQSACEADRAATLFLSLLPMVEMARCRGGVDGHSYREVGALGGEHRRGE